MKVEQDISTDNPEFDAVVREFEGPLTGYVTRILNNPEAARDVVQDTFLKYHKHWTSQGVECRETSGWLYRVAHNQAVDYIRKETRLKDLHERNAVAERLSDRAGESKERNEKMAIALDLVNELESPEKEVILLRLRDGLSYRDISKRTGRSEGNVGCLLHHAVKHLSEKLKRQGLISS